VAVAYVHQEREEISEIVRDIAKAWNRGDSTAFASYFTEDGDLVNIHGMRMRGPAAIANIYDMLFRGVFRRSRLEPEVSGSRQLCENTLLIQLRVGLSVPFGGMAGEHDCICSAVIQRDASQWRVASLHNTLVSNGAARQLVA
jgi:uncharacterized protein (TIGR02246 family)